MLRLKDKTKGGNYWNFTVPHTGHTMRAGNWFQLNSMIRAHLDANDFKDVVITEDAVEEECAKQAISINHDLVYESVPTPVSERRFQLGDVIRLSRSLFRNIAAGGRRVDPMEANRRADICATCQFNVAPGGCNSCSNSGMASAVVGTLVGNLKTMQDDKLQSCQHCGCFNKAQVWFPLEDLYLEPELDAQLPNHCWKKKQ